jgi:hypothetical protein
MKRLHLRDIGVVIGFAIVSSFSAFSPFAQADIENHPHLLSAYHTEAVSQGEIAAMISHLSSAVSELNLAETMNPGGFGGHRENAVQFLQQANEELGRAQVLIQSAQMETQAAADYADGHGPRALAK